jgi:Tol biopolymer transport system component
VSFNFHNVARPVLSLALLSILTILCSGCATNSLELSELPETPIAIRHWESEEGRQRMEMLGQTKATTPFALREGVAEIGNLSGFLNGETDRNVERRFPGRLALLNPKTLEVAIVEEAPLGSIPLSWSADHKRLIFSSDRRTGTHQIYELNMETRNVRKISYDVGGIIAAAHGPDNSYVYSRIREVPGRGFKMELMEYTVGHGQRVVVENAPMSHLALSPDGKTVTYAPQGRRSRDALGRQRRMVMLDLAPDSKPREIVPGEHPVYTPDGKAIVYIGRKDGRGKLYRMRANGSGRTAIGVGARTEVTPAVSPDGKYVAYVSDFNGLDRLFIIRFDGTGDRLFYDGGTVQWPVW